MRRAGILVLAASAAASCAGPRPTPPGSARPQAEISPARMTSTTIEDGGSLEAAVIVPSLTEREGLAWENDWILRRYGRYEKKSAALVAADGRHYDVVTIELPGRTEKVLYFDITGFFGR